jgi:hypothetical protein
VNASGILRIIVSGRLKYASLVEQRYVTTSYTEPVAREVDTTYSGGDADDMRSELASMSVEDFAYDRINDLAVDQPKIEAVGAPVISDDRLRNRIVVKQKYRVRDLWEDGEWTWYPRVLEELSVDRSTSVTETSTFRYEYVVDSNGRTVTIRQSLRSLRDSVDVKDIPEHLTKLSGIWSRKGYGLEPPGAREEKPVMAASTVSH